MPPILGPEFRFPRIVLALKPHSQLVLALAWKILSCVLCPEVLITYMEDVKEEFSDNTGTEIGYCDMISLPNQ